MQLEVPDELAVPREFLKPAAGCRAGEESFLVAELPSAEHVPILEEIRDLARCVFALPCPHNSSLHIHKVCRRRSQRRNQGYPANAFGILRSVNSKLARAAKSTTVTVADRMTFIGRRAGRPMPNPMESLLLLLKVLRHIFILLQCLYGRKECEEPMACRPDLDRAWSRPGRGETQSCSFPTL